jgi:hypothetical protein
MSKLRHLTFSAGGMKKEAVQAWMDAVLGSEHKEVILPERGGRRRGRGTWVCARAFGRSEAGGVSESEAFGHSHNVGILLPPD